jgi:hypothetical protein
MSDHVRWEVSSTGVAISPIWHATVYSKHRFCTPAEDRQLTEKPVNDMNYGEASAATKGAAMDIVALDAWNILRRECGA